MMNMLLKGQRTDTDPKFQWAALYEAFGEANKRRGVAAKTRKAAGGPRIVRTLPVTAASGMALRLANANDGPAYTPTVENHAATPLLLWMAQKDGTQTTPLPRRGSDSADARQHRAGYGAVPHGPVSGCHGRKRDGSGAAGGVGRRGQEVKRPVQLALHGPFWWVLPAASYWRIRVHETHLPTRFRKL